MCGLLIMDLRRASRSVLGENVGLDFERTRFFFMHTQQGYQMISLDSHGLWCTTLPLISSLRLPTDWPLPDQVQSSHPGTLPTKPTAMIWLRAVNGAMTIKGKHPSSSCTLDSRSLGEGGGKRDNPCFQA